MSRDRGAIVQPAVDVAEAARRVREAHVALIDAESQERSTAERAEQAREKAARKRLDLGRALMEARKAWPARGPKAKGWGEFLREQGIEQQRAWEWMRLAGYVEHVSPASPNDGETPERVPTYAEAGVDKRPRKGDEPTATATVDEDEDAEGDDEEPAGSTPEPPRPKRREWNITRGFAELHQAVMSIAKHFSGEERRALAHQLRNLIKLLEIDE